MLVQPLLEKLNSLGLAGFQAASKEQFQSLRYADLSFEERLGLLVDIECTRRADNGLRRRIRATRFAAPATIEDLNLSQSRGLDRSLILELV